MKLIEKYFRRFIRSWNESEKDGFILRFIHSMTKKEQEEVEKELDIYSAEEIIADISDDGDDVVDDFEESNKLEVR